MKAHYRGLFIFLGIYFMASTLLVSCKGKFTMPVGSTFLTPSVPFTPTVTNTPTSTNTPCGFCTPTFTPTVTRTFTATNTFTATATRTPTPPAPPTYTPTPNGTTIPNGLVMAAAYTASLVDYGFGFPVTSVLTLYQISVNRSIETTATCSLTTPSNGTIPVTWIQDVNFGAYWASQYGSYSQYSYVPNGVYTCNCTTSLGTISATMNAPGGINFSSNGASVTAVYPGNYDAANVSRIFPSPVTTYANTPGVSVGSPFTYPGSAYSSPSFPATFGTAYAAAMTISSYTGTANPVGAFAFVGTQVSSKQFTR